MESTGLAPRPIPHKFPNIATPDIVVRHNGKFYTIRNPAVSERLISDRFDNLEDGVYCWVVLIIDSIPRLFLKQTKSQYELSTKHLNIVFEAGELTKCGSEIESVLLLYAGELKLTPTTTEVNFMSGTFMQNYMDDMSPGRKIEEADVRQIFDNFNLRKGVTLSFADKTFIDATYNARFMKSTLCSSAQVFEFDTLANARAFNSVDNEIIKNQVRMEMFKSGPMYDTAAATVQTLERLKESPSLSKEDCARIFETAVGGTRKLRSRSKKNKSKNARR